MTCNLRSMKRQFCIPISHAIFSVLPRTTRACYCTFLFNTWKVLFFWRDGSEQFQRAHMIIAPNKRRIMINVSKQQGKMFCRLLQAVEEERTRRKKKRTRTVKYLFFVCDDEGKQPRRVTLTLSHCRSHRWFRVCTLIFILLPTTLLHFHSFFLSPSLVRFSSVLIVIIATPLHKRLNTTPHRNIGCRIYVALLRARESRVGGDVIQPIQR